MIDALITSKTRIKLLTRLFLNANSSAYLRGLEGEFGESSNAIRLELNRFEKAGLLTSSQDGIRKIFRANTSHPLFSDIHNILLKQLGIDHVVKKVVNGLGDIRRVYLTGNYANGIAEGDIELLFIGNDVDDDYLQDLVNKAEKMVRRRIDYNINTEEEESIFLKDRADTDYLLLWQSE